MKTEKKVWASVDFSFDVTTDLNSILITRTAYTNLFLKDDGTVGVDLHDMEIREIKYLGLSIDKYTDIKKFLDHHKEMGIDLIAMIDKDRDNKKLIEENINLKEIEKFLTKMNK